jgi:hypothetical protein
MCKQPGDRSEHFWGNVKKEILFVVGEQNNVYFGPMEQSCGDAANLLTQKFSKRFNPKC